MFFLVGVSHLFFFEEQEQRKKAKKYKADPSRSLANQIEANKQNAKT